MPKKKVSPEQLKYLFDQYISGCSSLDEELAFFQAVDDPAYRGVLFSLMDTYTANISSTGGLNDRQQARILNEVLQRSEPAEEDVFDKTNRIKIVPFASKTSSRRRYIWWKVAVIFVLIVLAVTVPYYLINDKEASTQAVVYTPFKGVIPPGSNKATLILSDGTELSLNDAANGALAQQGGSQVQKLFNGQLLYKAPEIDARSEQSNPANHEVPLQFNTITVPMGGEYRVVLADGTSVWLNSASSLRFPVSFNGTAERVVELTGEAYFEVSKVTRGKKRMPFIVRSQGQQVRVLGTHFNVNAYGGVKGTTTTLLEGSVVVERRGQFKRVLKPGQQSLVKEGIMLKKVDTSFSVAWKKGLFKFRDANIKMVMEQFAKWYNLDVEYQGDIPPNKFNGEIYRNMSATKALELLHLANIQFEVMSPNTKNGRKKIIIK